MSNTLQQDRLTTNGQNYTKCYINWPQRRNPNILDGPQTFSVFSIEQKNVNVQRYIEKKNLIYSLCSTYSLYIHHTVNFAFIIYLFFSLIGMLILLLGTNSFNYNDYYKTLAELLKP